MGTRNDHRSSCVFFILLLSLFSRLFSLAVIELYVMYAGSMEKA